MIYFDPEGGMTTQQVSTLDDTRSASGDLFQKYDGVTSLDQITTGFDLSLPRFKAYETYYRWYRREYRQLYRGGNNLVNGLSLFDFDDLIKLPIFNVTSKYYQDSALGRRPLLHTAEQALADWFNTLNKTTFDKIDESIEYWSITGRGVLYTTTDGKIRPADPVEWIPIQNPKDKDELIGHALVHRWREREENDLTRDDQNLKNRITVIKFTIATKTSTVETFRLDGNIIGASLVPEATSNVSGVFIYGNGQGFYLSLIHI